MHRFHLSLQTVDIEASTAFFSALFGSPPDKQKPDGYTRFTPDEHPLVLSLVPGTPGTLAAHDHFGLRFADRASTHAAWDRAEAAGLDLQGAGETLCCWSRQEKAWVHDPDGRPWELYTLLADAERPHAGQACCRA